MSEPLLIRVSTRAFGPREFVRVYVYDTLAEMREAGERFSGRSLQEAAAVTQAYSPSPSHWPVSTVIVRLSWESLRYDMVVHEMAHAALALLGKHTSPDAPLREVLTHYNEAHAYASSDLTTRLNERLFWYGERRA